MKDAMLVGQTPEGKDRTMRRVNSERESSVSVSSLFLLTDRSHNQRGNGGGAKMRWGSLLRLEA